jgi:hypothetical protein
MCEAFYSKSGQTSQISGKFCDVAFGFQNLKELQQTISGYFTSSDGKNQNRVIISSD